MVNLDSAAVDCSNNSHKTDPKLLKKKLNCMNFFFFFFFYINKQTMTMRRKWLKALHWVDFQSSWYATIHLWHFVDGKQNPVPTVFAYNDYKMRGAKTLTPTGKDTTLSLFSPVGYCSLKHFLAKLNRLQLVVARKANLSCFLNSGTYFEWKRGTIM